MTTPHLGALNEFCWMDLKTHDVPGTTAFFWLSCRMSGSFRRELATWEGGAGAGEGEHDEG
ncbi:hypothetical protein ACIHCL_36300, partial [Streptomyces sp. NPDC052042]